MWFKVPNQLEVRSRKTEVGRRKIEDGRKRPELLSSVFGLLTILIAFLISNTEVNAQALGINQSTPDASSILDAVSTTKGFLIPRMTTAQRTAIGAPVEGLLVFDTDLDEFYYYDATVTAGWRPLLAGSKASTTGAGFITMADATVLDMSAINASATTEGLKLPQATSITAATAEGQLSWDTDNDLPQIGTGAAIKTIGGMPNNMQVFTASGTWTRPTNVTKVWVQVWGAGGAGGTGSADQGCGGGGGGGYTEGLVTVSADVVVTVGVGGATSGTDGSLSSFAGATTLRGNGGNGSSGGGEALGGTGGTGQFGTITLTGGDAGDGENDDGSGGGNGGGSPMGGAGGSGGSGANASNPNNAGKAGVAPGGGGGGGGENGGAFGAGANGMVIVYW